MKFLTMKNDKIKKKAPRKCFKKSVTIPEYLLFNPKL